MYEVEDSIRGDILHKLANLVPPYEGTNNNRVFDLRPFGVYYETTINH